MMLTGGVYLLADESVLPFEHWQAQLRPCLSAGITLVQYRAKTLDSASRLAHAATLLEWCHSAQLPLLINDDVSLCARIGAAGVHVGSSDTQISDARTQLGAQALIGSSCYNDLERAQHMCGLGADYVSFGRLFASQTKPQATPATLNTLRAARSTLPTPICAIGGIDSHNAASVIQAGADLICVAGGILRQSDPCAATHKLATIANAALAQRSL